MNEPVIDLAADSEMTSVSDFDDRLFLASGEPAAYRAWAKRLGNPTDTANDAIRLAKDELGVDDPGFYRMRNLLRGTEFAR